MLPYRWRILCHRHEPKLIGAVSGASHASERETAPGVPVAERDGHRSTDDDRHAAVAALFSNAHRSLDAFDGPLSSGPAGCGGNGAHVVCHRRHAVRLGADGALTVAGWSGWRRDR